MTHRSTARPTRRQAALSFTALAALALTACGSGEAEFNDPQDTPAEAGPEESAPEGGDASDSGGQDSPPQTDDQAPRSREQVDPDDAVATVTYTLPTDEIDGTMTLGLHHLRVRGDTVELLLTYTPEFDSNEAHTLLDLHGRSHQSVAPALFDRDHLKRYEILRKGKGWHGNSSWNSAHDQHELASGDTQAYWANFAAPQDDIETINVAVPGAPEFEDVPLERDSGTSSEETGTAEDGQE